MKRILMTTCALAALTGFAVAQSSTTTNQPAAQKPESAQKSDTMQPSKPSSASQTNAASTTSAKPGIQRVDAASLVMTFYTANPADTRASKIIGQDVYNLQNENIGEVTDIIIDNGKMIKAIVVGVGGFLGMGERNVAIAPASVVMSETSDGSARLVVNTTKENLKNAQAFNFADVDKAGPNAGKSTTGSSTPSASK